MKVSEKLNYKSKVETIIRSHFGGQYYKKDDWVTFSDEELNKAINEICELEVED